MTRTIVFGIASVLVLLTAAEARAGTIIGGSDLVTPAYHAQLEAWLGEGPVDLTNIFDKAPGNTSHTFHNAVDGKGRTITVIEVTGGVPGVPVIIGGYNPLSWTSFGNYHISPVGDRDAFIFNLTAAQVRYQNPTDGEGQYQTFDHSNVGPTFGGGHDIYVSGNLTIGYNYSYSYGTQTQGVPQGYSSGIAGPNSFNSLQYGRIEVFTISPAQQSAVPEPASLAIWGLGALGATAVGLIRRKRRR
jgi:hypothetical protein